MFVEGVLWESTLRLLFSSNDSRLEGVIQLIHLDLGGPISSTYLTGYEYYVTFIDDFSMKI